MTLRDFVHNLKEENGYDMEQHYRTLNTGARMPLLGLGVYDMHGAEAVNAVTTALQTGYRLIDTAALYGNEQEIGEAIRHSGLPRRDIFLTTKVGDADQGYDATMKAFETSMQRLRTEYIDLYLIHWPLPDTRRDTWRALESLYREGRVRAIGVANYLLPFLLEMSEYAGIVPAVNQVEFSPFLFLKDLMERCEAQGTILQAYTPLLRGRKMDDARLQRMATNYGKTPAQLLLRWAIEHGVSTIPKSAHPDRIRENFGVFDFSISPSDMSAMDSWNENFRVVEDPMMYWQP